MPRIARSITLWKRKEIINLFRKARRIYQHEELDISITPHTEELSKVLIVVPSRVGTAPQRNKIRRRIKSIFYENKLYKEGYHWIFFVKPSATKLTFAQLHAIIIACLPYLKK